MFLALVDIGAWAVILFLGGTFVFLGGYILCSKLSDTINRFVLVATPKNWLALALALAVGIWIVIDLAHQLKAASVSLPQ